MAERPYIDYEKCTLKRTCMEVCPAGVFAEENGKMVVKYPEKCIQCRACEVSCPEKAITVKE